MNRQVELIDRSEAFERMNEALSLDPERTAVVTIDMQRGALDPRYATLGVPEDEGKELLATLERTLNEARGLGVPVVHVLTFWNRVELAKHPFEQAVLAQDVSLSASRRDDYSKHKLEGSPGAETMPALADDEKDYFITSKRTFDMFYGTNLEVLLRALGVDTLVIAGVNTNTCVQCSTFGAYNRGYKAVVLSDGSASAYGGDLHTFALENVARRLGWVMSGSEFLKKIREG